ncbi:MAG: hypothetical protein ACOCR6_01845 [archaeon]
MADQFGSEEEQLEAIIETLELDGVTIDELRNILRADSPSRAGELIVGDSSPGDWSGMEARLNGSDLDIAGGRANTPSTGEVTLSGYQFGSAIPDSVVDNFEDADADPAGPYESGEGISDYYGGDTGSANRQTGTVYEGAHALELSSESAIISTSGLPRYPAQGDTFSARIYLAGNSNDCGILYGCPSEAGEGSQSGYLTSVNDTNDFTLYRYDGGSVTEIGSDSGSASTGEWWEIEVAWGTDDSHEATFYDSSGTEQASISATDDTYTDTGVGFRASGTTIYADQYEIL